MYKSVVWITAVLLASESPAVAEPIIVEQAGNHEDSRESRLTVPQFGPDDETGTRRAALSRSPCDGDLPCEAVN